MIIRYVCSRHALTVEVNTVVRSGKIEVTPEPGKPLGQCWLSTNFHRAFHPRNEDLAEVSDTGNCAISRQ